MAKNSIRDYDATSGNNTDVQSVDISEGCAATGSITPFAKLWPT